MLLSHEDFQKARRISRAIQEYLEETNQEGLRTTDLYPILVKKGLIEKDRHQGLHFRKFLRKLKENNLLSLIPQCQCRPTDTEFVEWFFYKGPDLSSKNEMSNKEDNTIIGPEISEEEINLLIIKAKPHIDNLPLIDSSKLTPQALEIRKSYPRAYEIWTDRELEIITRAFSKFKRFDKVAELLRRQPSVVRRKIEALT